MTLYVIMGVMALIAIGVIGFLFYFLNNEEKQGEQDVKPVLDLSEFKKELPLDSFQVPVMPVHQTLAAESTPKVSLAEEAYHQRVIELEEELHILSEKSLAQAQEALSMIDQLKRQNEEIEDQKRQMTTEFEVKLDEAKVHLTRLRQDNAALQNQVDVGNAKIVALEDEVVFTKKQMEVELVRVNVQSEDITREKDEAVTEAVNFKMASIQTQLEQLQQANAALQESNVQYKELNTPLNAKLELLQYELTKNRAQVSGLERACANYKVQMEELLARIESGVTS